ncbi:amphoterin-induced protein 1 [Fundulus heteroclitus]|uniref:amphoterin-induced protein 1 n=1 Tax=Fundulus heteroclitus TaxID=8078 RepID=UPI00165CC33A|nr:amphoterin-induced protein 1 [Fundulus heteroclitus]XP_021172773.2 amphoterin-induced protein 1 [Fundulus heteroclitus]
MLGASRGSFILFLHLVLLFPEVRVNKLRKGKLLDYQTLCVCAGNIISCSKVNLTDVTVDLPEYTAVLDLSFNSIKELRAAWTIKDLKSLEKMLLNNNGLTFLSSEAFVHVPQLRYLDLSYNGLKLLDEFIFEPLEHLEVLLLFKNRISQIDRTAFSTMGALQKLYLSHNQISRLPLEVLKERSKQDSFKLLDVSSNKIKVLPVQELQAMRAWIKNSVYFHNNPLTCSCELYNLVAIWHLRGLGSASNFAGNHTCGGSGKQNVKILDLNCTEVNVLKKEAYLEQTLLLDCDTRQKYMSKSWVLPGNITEFPTNRSDVKDGGNYLSVGPLKVEDSGVYTCHATNGSFSDTLHINLVVYNYTKRGGLDDLKTAYTTLGACVISVVLILAYLYVTPRCCAYCSSGTMEKDEPGESLHSSTVSLPVSHGDRGAEAGPFVFRHGASQDSKDLQELNGRLNPIGEEDEEWPKESRKS